MVMMIIMHGRIGFGGAIMLLLFLSLAGYGPPITDRLVCL
jgi:hypothetical protein